VFIVGLAVALATGASGATDQEQGYAARALRDAACMRLDQIADARGRSVWVLARVTPDPAGPHEEVTMRFDPSKAGLVPDRSPEVHLEEGTIALGTLSRTPEQRTFGYRWKYTPVNGGPDPGPEFAPFRDGPSLVVCRFNSYAEGEAKCSPNYLLPREWEKWVAPAVDARRRRAGAPPVAKATRAQGAANLEEPNPLLVIDEFRRRTDDGSEEHGFGEKPLRENRGFLQAVLTYLFVTSAEGRRGAIERSVARVIAGAQSQDSITGLTLGVVAAGDDAVSDDTRKTSDAILRDVKARCDGLRSEGKDVEGLERAMGSSRTLKG